MSNIPNQLTPEEITKIGERFYFDELKDKLEAKNTGEFVVIDAATRQYVVSPDKLEAIEKAKKTLGDKLFLIIQIGSLHQTQGINFRSVGFSTERY